MLNVGRAVSFLALMMLLPSPAWSQLRAVPYVGGFVTPVEFVQDPSDPTVQYVAQQGGLVRVIKDGIVRSTPFIDLTGLVSAGGERGLLGLAFPPNYSTSGRFYVYYTRVGNGSVADVGDIVIARYKRSTGNPLVADPLTRKDLVWGGLPYIEHSSAANHNGGHLAFGPDGYLYIAVGDGGNTPEQAQATNSLLGKLLRININVADGDALGYAVPPDNPFVDTLPVAALTQIWAFGLRNPWKFSFDDVNGGTNALIVADVGQAAWEEINYEPSNQGGRNYGWMNREGRHDYFTVNPPAYPPLTEPIFEYEHSIGNSITGGFVYRGSAMRSAVRGRYFYADFVRGRVWSLGLTIGGGGEATATDLVEHTAELGGSDTLGAISAFGRDASGELYIVSYAGTIFKIVDVTPAPDIDIVTFNDNGDSYRDLLLYNRATGAWTIQHGNAQGQFPLARSGGWATGWQILVANFNADALEDLFLYNRSTGVWVKVMNTAGGFSYFAQTLQPGFSVYITEFSGDGRSDVFFNNPASGVWLTCISTGTGAGGFTCGAGGWRPGWQLFPADFDGDNQTDFLLYDPVGGIFVKAIWQGNALFTYYGGGWAGGWLPVIAELNGDIRDDVLLYNPVIGIFVRCTSLGDGTGAFSYSAGGWAAGWSVKAADFDGDGRTDIFLYHSTGTWVKAINTGADFNYFGGGWRLWETTITDLNADGNSDVLLYDRSTAIWVQALSTTPQAFTYTAGAFPR